MKRSTVALRVTASGAQGHRYGLDMRRKLFYTCRTTSVVTLIPMAGEKGIHLSEAQLAVMRTLWSEGEAATATVHERMGKPRSLAYTTVATMLGRLEKRGLVRSRKDGRERVFEPLVTEAEVRQHMVSDLVSKLFRGNPGALVSHLVSNSEFDQSDLEAVRKMLRNEPRVEPND